MPKSISGSTSRRASEGGAAAEHPAGACAACGRSGESAAAVWELVRHSLLRRESSWILRDPSRVERHRVPKRWFRVITLVLGGLGALFIVSCDWVLGTDCTTAGCDSGIEVRLEQEPPRPYRIEVGVGGSQARYVFECTQPDGCSSARFDEFAPDLVLIDVIAGTDTASYTVRPEYTKNQPNGPDCDPTCYNAV